MKRYTEEEARRIGARLKSARALTALNQVQFCSKHGLSISAVKTWETGKFTPRLKNLEGFCQALQAEGILDINAEWFLEGVGPAPTRLKSGEQDNNPPPRGNDINRAAQTEAALFKKHQKSRKKTPVVVAIADELMRPFFAQGDLVGGVILDRRPHRKNISKQPYLLETHAGHFAARWVLSDGRSLFIKNNVDQELIKLGNQRIANIIWHRRLD